MLGVFLLTPTLAYTSQINLSSLTEDQREFLHAYDAIKANDRKLIAHYKKQLKDYELYPYLLYLDYRYHFKDTPESIINQFFQTYPDNALTPFLRNRYLRFLGKNKKSELFLKYYQTTEKNATDLQCYYVQSKVLLNQSDAILPVARSLWRNQISFGRACRFVDTYLRDNKYITGSMVWHRLTQAMYKGKIKQARKISQDLSKTDRKTVHYWLKIYKNPNLVSNDMPDYISTVNRKSIFIHGVRRFSYFEPEKALTVLNLRADQYGLSLAEKNDLRQSISLRFAYRFHPEASSYLAKLDEAAQNDKVMSWRLQLAIRNSDWINYLDLYALLPSEEKTDNRWLYWKARAFAELNQPDKADDIFKSLATERNFYGFLSADKLDQPYRFNPAPRDHYDMTNLMKKYPQLSIIKELIAINWKVSVKREWYHLLNIIDSNDIEAIAGSMAEWEQHNLAIQTVAKAKKWDDLDLRFPTPYKQPVLKAAKKHTIDPAWIYGVIRRESAFSDNIRSPVGAIGLMQLMPATAKYIGRKMGLKRRQYSQLTNAESNIELGSAYLSYLHKKYDGNRILATAAYNAGPNRVDTWIPKNKLIQADQWIDTIPFTETRAYVKAVMEYTTIFKSVLNQRYDRLENFMQPIGQTPKPLR